MYASFSCFDITGKCESSFFFIGPGSRSDDATMLTMREQQYHLDIPNGKALFYSPRRRVAAYTLVLRLPGTSRAEGEFVQDRRLLR